MVVKTGAECPDFFRFCFFGRARLAVLVSVSGWIFQTVNTCLCLPVYLFAVSVAGRGEKLHPHTNRVVSALTMVEQTNNETRLPPLLAPP